VEEQIHLLLASQIAIEQEGSLHAAAVRLGVTDRALQLRRAARREKGDLYIDGAGSQAS